MKSILQFLIILLSISALCPATLRSEFYRYVTKDGKVFYVDDISKIPEEYWDQLKIYREKYDHLPEKQKLLMIEKDRDLDEQRTLEEKRRKEQLERERYLKSLQTKVTIIGNQILVPVQLGHGWEQIETLFLLDTGASQIVLYKKFADKLNIEPRKQTQALLAGGKIINTENAKLDHFKVGPIKMENIDVIIIKHDGPPINFDGLLGMNFLRNVEYSIDFQNQMIRWKPPKQPF
jgi:clan AA aspartic protease (TIGR02281 family)